MGKIARNQHLPAIGRSAFFRLVATVDRCPEGVKGVPHFADISELVASGMDVDAVSICTPPQVRHAITSAALQKRWHVFLEKPPGATLTEVSLLADQAEAASVSLFAGWHSRFAPGVEPARAWLTDRRVKSAMITWREDVRRWHPGQDWIFEPGGFGVFDPGINALSIATRILRNPLLVEHATIDVPSNRAAPIAAQVEFVDVDGARIGMDLDFRQMGVQRWDIRVETDDGMLELTRGGHLLSIDGRKGISNEKDLLSEYSALYSRFATIIRTGVSDFDIGPLRLVGDAFLRARINVIAPFQW